jgi:hypothetical protein
VADLVLSVSLDGRIDYANAAAVRTLAGDGALSLAGHKVQDVLALTTEYAPGSVLDVSVLLDRKATPWTCMPICCCGWARPRCRWT